jgi:hypothetical protein
VGVAEGAGTADRGAYEVAQYPVVGGKDENDSVLRGEAGNLRAVILRIEAPRSQETSADTLDLQTGLGYSSPMLTNLVGKIGNYMGGKLL